MKFSKLLLVGIGFIGLFAFHSFDASAATKTKPKVTCTSTNHSYVSSTTQQYSEGSAYNTSYSYPSTPYQTSDVHDRALSSGDFSSTYTKYWNTDTSTRTDTTTASYTVKSCSDGTSSTSATTYSDSYSSWSFYRTNYYSTSYSSPISVTQTSGSLAAGYENFSAVATSPAGTSTGSGTSYFVNQVNVSVGSKSYEDQAMPSPTCVATYGDGDTKSCTSSIRVSSDSGANANQRQTCYYYTENTHSDTACTTRVYVQSVQVTGPANAYTGLHQYYTCNATFYDGYVENVSNQNVWSSSNYNYIGNSWLNTGYTDPRGTKHYPTSINDFYPAASSGSTYGITCIYYPNSFTHYSNNWISDTPRQKSNTMSVRLHGISNIRMEMDGNFETSTGVFSYIDSNAIPGDADFPFNSSNQYTKYDFMKGHFYNFDTYIQYDDGTDGFGSSGWRNITTAPEVYWTNSPWYSGYSAYNAPSGSTNMTTSGRDHRIPQDGWNTISAKYFNTNVPYGLNSNTTTTYRQLWAHEITSLQIHGTQGVTSAPLTTVTAGQIVHYTAWINWSDVSNNPFGRGKPEDWTNFVTWNGDDLIGTGTYQYPNGNTEQQTISAQFGNTAGWDEYVYDSKTISISDSCQNLDHLVWGCALPSTWQTTGFSKTAINFLPPAYVYKYSQWDQTTNPYEFYYKFQVTGISDGVGRN